MPEEFRHIATINAKLRESGFNLVLANVPINRYVELRCVMHGDHHVLEIGHSPTLMEQVYDHYRWMFRGRRRTLFHDKDNDLLLAENWPQLLVVHLDEGIAFEEPLDQGLLVP